MAKIVTVTLGEREMKYLDDRIQYLKLKRKTDHVSQADAIRSALADGQRAVRKYMSISSEQDGNQEKEQED